MTKKKTADKRVPMEIFVPAYLKAVESGLTREDLAKSLGIQASSIYQRIYAMHQQGACRKTFPHLSTTGRRSIVDRIQAAVDEYRKGSGQKAVIAAATKPSPKKAAAKKHADPPVTVELPVGGDGDLDPTAALERLLNG